MFEKEKDWLKSRLNEERYIHSLGAKKAARELAKKFGVDQDKAAYAALIHDNAKNMHTEELLKIIEDNNLDVSETEKRSPKTLHAPVSAYIAEKELGIEDQDVLNAIRFHTIGRIDMSMLEKIVYLADKIEEHTRDEKFRAKILKVIHETHSIDEAILLTYKATIKSLVDRRLTISPETIEVWNHLVIKLEKPN